MILLLASPVSSFLTVTVAPGITPFDWSVTMPRRVAAERCANAGAGNHTARHKTSQRHGFFRLGHRTRA